MKRGILSFAVLSLLVAAVLIEPASAQTKRERKKENVMSGVVEELGGFTAPTLRLARISDEWAIMVGGRIGVLINKQLWTGIGWHFKVDKSVKADFRAGDRMPYLSLHYGGLELEYTLPISEVFFVSVHSIFGIGFYGFTDPEDVITFRNESFYIAEPGLYAETQFTKWLRVQIGSSYRFVTGVDDLDIKIGRVKYSYPYSNSALAGHAVSLTLKFGDF